MEDFEEKEIKELVDKFKRMINSGESNYFDSDDMELIIEELMRIFDFKYASKAIDYAIGLYPSDPFFRILRVKQLILELELDAAEKELNEIEIMFPPTPEFYLEKVLLSRMIGSDINTFSLLKKAMDLDAEDPEIHFLLAYEYLKKREIQKAIKYTTFALSEDELFDEQLFTFSYLFEDNKQYEDAIEFFTAISNKFPLNKGSWFGLGLAYSWLNDYKSAIDAYGYVLSLDEETSTAHFNIANSYYELKDFNQALEHYKQAYEFDNEDYNSVTCIGDCYSIMGQLDEAMDYYHQALVLNPNHSDAILGIVSILKQNEKTEEARLFIEKAFSLNPQSFELLFAVIDYYEDEEQIQKLKELFELTIQQIENRVDFYKYFILYCCNNELYDLGIEILESHLDDENITFTAPYYLAALYFLNGNIEKGVEYLKNALLINYDEYSSTFLSIDPLLESFSEIKELIELYKP
ncbi:MAG: tetratricopeptide repeat protein [Bacteroidales bacterium]